MSNRHVIEHLKQRAHLLREIAEDVRSNKNNFNLNRMLSGYRRAMLYPNNQYNWMLEVIYPNDTKVTHLIPNDLVEESESIILKQSIKDFFVNEFKMEDNRDHYKTTMNILDSLQKMPKDVVEHLVKQLEIIRFNSKDDSTSMLTNDDCRKVLFSVKDVLNFK